MSFIHWWAIGIGSLALVGPLAVHFLTRPRPVSHPLSSIRFLREVIQQKRARSRLRDFLILLLRLLAIGLLALALARPMFDANKGVQAIPSDATSRVIVIDISQSMAAGVAGTSVMKRAQGIALRYLDSSANIQASVIFAGAQPQKVFGRLSPNLASLRDAVKDQLAVGQRCDVQAAMTEAGRQFTAADAGHRELVVISDFQRGNWSNLHLDRIPADTKIQLESVALGEIENVAITGVRCQTTPVVHQESVLEIDVANFRKAEIDTECDLELSVVGSSPLRFHAKGQIPSQSTVTLTVPVQFDRPGWYRGWAKLSSNDDPLLEDDRRPVALEVFAVPRIVLASRQLPDRIPSSSYYLEQALRISVGDGMLAEGHERQSVHRVVTPQLPFPQWPAADLYVINHPGALEEATWKGLANRVRRGKGLLFVASDLVDGINLNQLSESLGSGFQPPVLLQAPASGKTRKDLFIRSIKENQLPFRIFGDDARNALQTVRISGGLASQATAEGLRHQVQAELSDSSSLMYITSCDAGQIAVINADLDESNWCVEPTFLPVIGETMQALFAGRRRADEAPVGEPMVRLLGTEVDANASLVARPFDKLTQENRDTASSDSMGQWEWSAGQECMIWSWPVPVGPGVFELVRDNKEVVSAVATCAPAVESDLKSLEKSILEGRLAEGRDIAFADVDSDGDSKDQWWTWMIVACILGLASEIAALRWFRT